MSYGENFDENSACSSRAHIQTRTHTHTVSRNDGGHTVLTFVCCASVVVVVVGESPLCHLLRRAAALSNSRPVVSFGLGIVAIM